MNHLAAINAMTHADIYEAVHRGPGGGAAMAAEDTWRTARLIILAAEERTHAAITASAEGWEGGAADAARTGLSSLNAWVLEAITDAQNTATSLTDQGFHAGDLRNGIARPHAYELFDAQSAAMLNPADRAASDRLARAESTAQNPLVQAQGDIAKERLVTYVNDSYDRLHAMSIWTAPPAITVDTSATPRSAPTVGDGSRVSDLTPVSVAGGGLSTTAPDGVGPGAAAPGAIGPGGVGPGGAGPGAIAPGGVRPGGVPPGGPGPNNTGPNAVPPGGIGPGSVRPNTASPNTVSPAGGGPRPSAEGSSGGPGPRSAPPTRPATTSTPGSSGPGVVDPRATRPGAVDPNRDGRGPTDASRGLPPGGGGRGVRPLPDPVRPGVPPGVRPVAPRAPAPVTPSPTWRDVVARESGGAAGSVGSGSGGPGAGRIAGGLPGGRADGTAAPAAPRSDVRGLPAAGPAAAETGRAAGSSSHGMYPPMGGAGGGRSGQERRRASFLIDDSGAFDVSHIPYTDPVIGGEPEPRP